MKDNRKSEIRVGITVVFGFILLTWIFFWAKNISIFNEDILVKVEFNSVAGLETGDAVTINGLRKGYVNSIELEGNKIFVSMYLNNTVDLRSDAGFSILMADLMGTKKIEINPGQNKNKLDLTGIHKGYFSGDISTAMAMLSSVQNDLVAVIKDFRISLDNINNLFADEEFTRNIKSSFENINMVSKKMAGIIDQNKKALNELLIEGKNLTKESGNFLKENSEEINKFLEKSSTVFENINTLISKSEKLINETLAGKNNAGKLLYDEDLMNDLKKSTSELKELLKLFNEQLKGEGLKVDAHIF